MLASLAEASAILERSDYRSVAEANAHFLLAHLQKDGLLLRSYKDGEAKLNAYLEDYACLIHGLISVRGHWRTNLDRICRLARG